MAELAVRRDQLAHELESRIAGERRASKELDGRWRELDRLVRTEHEQASTCEAQLHSIEAALTETDARLRYRRLELNTDLRWTSDGDDREQILAELDEQITRWRATVAELAKREATARARLALLHTEHVPIASPLAEQQAWLAVARQLSADLAGEISRLARASASKQCVCQDAHPRLRPIAETIQRQLEVLESLLAGHRSDLDARDLRAEVEYLSRAEGELQQHVDHLLNRRVALIQGARTPRLHADHQSSPSQAGSAHSTDMGHVSFSAADLDQLEQRRLELEQDRFQLVEQARTHRRKLRDLRAQRDTVSRQRAALLSVRSIEHVQRELADVQRKLEQATDGAEEREDLACSSEHPSRASDYLAQLTDGKLVRLALVDQGRRAHVMTSAGESIPVEALSAAERDQVYLSLCLALLSAAARRGVWLPLLLDDPFVRLDARSTASLAVVLEAFCRQGHQVIVFTGQQAAAERLASLGIAVRDIASLRYVETATPAVATTAVLDDSPGHVPPSPERQREPRRAAGARRKKGTAQPPRNGKASAADQSDAA
jgi:DNA repair exonuclease SbcCD ATPase subunit